MATINYDYYDEKDIYNDGNIETYLLNYYKHNKEKKYYKEEMFYTTTQIRENILNWYPFSKKGTVLEIGAGVGTITEMLCDKCEKVVSIEASKRRAEILYERCKTKDNLEVYVANLNDLQLNQKFDYITLIGVFEYAKLFCNTDNPFIDFLNNIKKYLKPNGKILLAIENRYGIKYFAGNSEDHLNEKYIGLYGYHNSNIQTFGKNELIEIFKKCKLNYYKFYYVFPDYKLPQVIYTDCKMPTLDECYNIPIFNHGNQSYEFNPRKVLPGLVENNQLGFFANSFLVEIGTTDKNFSDISYVKQQPYRSEPYKTITIMNQDHKIYKESISKKADQHLKVIDSNHRLIKENGINICNCTLNNENLKIEYIDGKNIYEIILENTKKNNVEIENIIDEYITYILTECSTKRKMNRPIDDRLLKVYNKEISVLKVGLLDLNMGNVIKNKNGKYYLIDQEWITDKDLPTDYAIYFSIKLLFEHLNVLSEVVSEKYLYKKYNISKEKQKLFDEISVNYFDGEKKFKDFESFKRLMNSSSIKINQDQINEICKNYENEIKRISEVYENEIKRIDAKHEERIKKISNNYENEIKRMSNEYIQTTNQIYNSISWKITKPLRRIIEIINIKKHQ